MSIPQQPNAMAYTQGFGSSPLNVQTPHLDIRAPSSADVQYSVGQRWVNTIGNATYTLTSFSASAGVTTANWQAEGGGTSQLSTLSGDTGTANPVAGNIQIAGGAGVVTSASGAVVTVSLTGGGVAIDSFVPDTGTNPVVPSATGSVTMAGTANQITTTGGLNTLTYSLPATLIAPGSVAATTFIETLGGNITAQNTAPGSVVTNSSQNLSAAASSDAQMVSVVNSGTAGDPYFRATVSGAKDWVWGIDNSDSDAWVVCNSATIGTTNVIRADAGSSVVSFPANNISMPTAGTAVIYNPTIGSGAAGGTVNCNGRVGSVTFTGASIAAGATQSLVMGNTAIAGSSTRIIFSMIGGVAGTSLSISSYTSAANQVTIVVGNGTGATTQTGNLTFDFELLN